MGIGSRRKVVLAFQRRGTLPIDRPAYIGASAAGASRTVRTASGNGIVRPSTQHHDLLGGP